MSAEQILWRVVVGIQFLFIAAITAAQTAGPNDPGSAGNNASIGSAPWSVPANGLSSNDQHASASTKGISQFLTVSDFGFALPIPSDIVGIQLDVERSTSGAQNVAVLDGWSTGLTKAISAGSNRCLIVAYAQENGSGSRDITAMTYGGRPMTQVADRTAGTSGGFMARLEVWMLLEADIALASSSLLVPTYGSYTEQEYCETFSAVTFQHVDQLAALTSLQVSGAIDPPNNANPHQLGSAITTLAGSMAVNVVTAGNNTSPATTNGGTNTYSINSGYTEGTDIYFANTSVAPNSGACFQTAHKAISANGTEQPTCTFAGSVNRWAMIGFTLQRARELDHRVMLMDGGSIGGSDLSAPTAWPDNDTYATYGGSTELWGRSWGTLDINSNTFGAAVAARVQNGTARVDHMRITVTYINTLPIELLDFRATTEGSAVHLEWATATEDQNAYFSVQRSGDNATFQEIDRVLGAGTSQVTMFYSCVDHAPLPGTSYYRLQQVDTDGNSTFSPVVSVLHDPGSTTVFPNPTMDGSVTILDEEARSASVAVYDGALRMVRHSDVLTGDPVDLLGGLPDGDYTLLIETGSGHRAVRVSKTSRSR